jgi:lysozyme family protein
MLNNFAACLAFTLSQEGGYSDDPDDPGGATQDGITLQTLRDYRDDQSLTPADLQAMTTTERDDIYRLQYWEPVNGDGLPDGCDQCVFDFAVNAGVETSSKSLQAILGVTVDGAIGKTTTGAAVSANVLELINKFTLARIDYYDSLNQSEFIDGWLNRVKACEITALGMLPTA